MKCTKGNSHSRRSDRKSTLKTAWKRNAALLSAAVSALAQSGSAVQIGAGIGAVGVAGFGAQSLLAQTFPPSGDSSTAYTVSGANGIWSTCTWSPAMVAGGANSDAIWFNSSVAAAGAVNITLDTAATTGNTFQLNSLWIGGTNNGVFTLAATTGASLVFSENGSSTLPTVTFSGTNAKGVVISAPISLNLSAGQALTFDTAVNTPTGAANTSTANPLTLSGGVTGTGDLFFTEAGAVTNSTTSLNNTGNLGFSNTGAVGFTNGAGIGANVVNVSFNNTGAVTIGGTGTIGNTGSLSFNNGGLISYTNTGGIGSTITTLNVGTSVSSVNLGGGLANTGAVTFSNSTTTNINGAVANGSTAAFNGLGITTITGAVSNGGNISFGGGAVVITGPFGNTGTASFLNTGTVNLTSASGILNTVTALSAGTGVTAISITGNVANSSTLSFSNTGTTYLAGNLASGGNVQFAGTTATIVGSVGNTGTLTYNNTGSTVLGGLGASVTNANFNGDGGITINGVVGNHGSFTSTMSVTGTTGTNVNFYVLAGGTAATNAIAFTTNVGNVELNSTGSGTQFTNTGVVSLYGSVNNTGSFSSAYGAQFVITTNAGSVAIGTTVTNVNLIAGFGFAAAANQSVTINGAVQNSGTFYVQEPTNSATPGTIVITGNLANGSAAGFTNSGAVTIGGAVNTTVGNLEFNTGATTIVGGVSNTGTLTFDGQVTAAGSNVYLGSGIATNVGNVQMNNSGSVTILGQVNNTGTFGSTYAGSGTHTTNSTFYFLANGTTATGNNLAIGPTVGNVNINTTGATNSGWLALAGEVNNTGSFSSANGGYFNITTNAGTVAFGTSVTNVNILAGYGSTTSAGAQSTVNGNINNSGSFYLNQNNVSAGTTGALTINGNLNNGSGTVYANAGFTNRGDFNLLGSVGSSVGNVTFNVGYTGNPGIGSTITGNIANNGNLTFNGLGAISLYGLIQTTGNVDMAQSNSTGTGNAANMFYYNGTTNVANMPIPSSVNNLTVENSSGTQFGNIANGGNTQVGNLTNKPNLAMTVNGNLTSSGSLTVDSGTLTQVNSGIINPGGNVYINGGQVISGTTTTSTGGQNWFIQGGNLVLGNGAAGGIYLGSAASSVVTWTSGGIAPYNEVGNVIINNPFTLNTGTATALYNAAEQISMTLAGPLSVAGNSTILSTGGTGVNVWLAMDGQISGTGSLSLGIGGQLAYISGQNFIIKGATNNVNTGDLDVISGITKTEMTGAYNATGGNINIGNGYAATNLTQPTSLQIASAQQQILTGSTVTVNGAGLSPTGTNTAVTGVLDLWGNSQTITFLQGNGWVGNGNAGAPILTLAPTSPDTFSGTIANYTFTAISGVAGGNATYTKSTVYNLGVVIGGSALQTFSGANLYNNTTINTGAALQASNAQALGSGTLTAVGTFVGNFNGSLTNAVTLNGGSLNGVSGFTGVSGNVTLGTAGGTVNLNDYATPANGINLNISGAISGANTLTVTGGNSNAGVLNLSGPNTYTGGSVVNTGTLLTGTGAALGFGTVLPGGAAVLAHATTVVNVGGTLDLNGQTITEPTTLSGGTLTNSGAGLATLTSGVLGTTFTAPTATFSSGSTLGYSSGSAAAVLYDDFSTASLNLTSGGSGYGTNVPTCTISLVNGAALTNATITVHTNTSTGQVTSLALNNAGDYLASLLAPTNVTLTFSATGTQTAATASITDGHLTLVGLQQTVAGDGYIGSPTATISGGGGATLGNVIGSLTLSGNNTIGGNNGDIEIDAAISGTGTFNKTGSNNLFLTNKGNGLANGFTATSGNINAQAAAGFGSVIGSGAVNLAGGTLTINDDGAATPLHNLTLPGYGNNINANSGASTLSVNPVTTGSSNTAAFGTLAFGGGSLAVNATGGYGVSFTSITGNGNLTTTAPLSATSLALNGNTVTNNSTGNMQIGTLTGGGTLAGSGAFTVTGKVQPGDAPQVLQANGLSVASTANYSAELYGPGWVSGGNHNAGSGYDSIQMSGSNALSVASGATLNLIDTNYTSPNAGDNFFIVVNGSNAGMAQFSTVEFDGNVATVQGYSGPNGGSVYYDGNSPAFGNFQFELNYDAAFSTGALTGGNDLAVSVEVVPEPTSLSLLGLGAMGLLARRRRRKVSSTVR